MELYRAEHFFLLSLNALEVLFWYILVPFTPWKINMEPKNHPIERKIIFHTIIFRFHVNLPGCMFFFADMLLACFNTVLPICSGFLDEFCYDYVGWLIHTQGPPIFPVFPRLKASEVEASMHQRHLKEAQVQKWKSSFVFHWQWNFFGIGTCGCFLKWWYPRNIPKWAVLVGKPMVVGYHHFRNPPCRTLHSRSVTVRCKQNARDFEAGVGRCQLTDEGTMQPLYLTLSLGCGSVIV